MADHFEVVKNIPGFGSRFSSSVKGVLFGVVLFFGAFPVLWWSENRQNLAEFVQKAEFVAVADLASIPKDKLIKSFGKLTTSEVLIDAEFLNSAIPTNAVQLSRDVEMYVWDEKSKTEQKNGKEIKTYDYVKTWSGRPEDSSKFYDSTNHVNPTQIYQDADFQVNSAMIGAVPLDAAKATFWNTKDYKVGVSALNVREDRVLQVVDGVIYVPRDLGGTNRSVVTQPEVGDYKVSYNYFPANVDVTVVGTVDQSKLVPHVFDDETFLGVYQGTDQEFEAFLQSRHNTITWVLRLVTFMMLWIGLNLILGPILTLVGSLPLVGNMGKSAIGLVTGAIAFFLWLTTLFLANFWLVLLILTTLVVGGLLLAKRNKAQSGAV